MILLVHGENILETKWKKKTLTIPILIIKIIIASRLVMTMETSIPFTNTRNTRREIIYIIKSNFCLTFQMNAYMSYVLRNE